ncbi:hypothetical protein [Arthrobacter sp. CG_A4]|uniref:hypothetical protein n=1 Tax=Arthrobacter sp. CG_A4 TaxID=3071706 RepID=UPI002DFA5AAC|nr:hypothetical protein [Arthrobacter sp. CG_A4]
MHSQIIDAFDVNGRTTVRSGDGVFLRVPLSTTGATADVELTGGLAGRVRAELAERREARIRPRLGRESIGILAPESWRQELAEALSGRAATVMESANNIPLSAGLVLHIPGSPQDRGTLDHLPAAGTAVLRCYREGELFFVDPLAMGPRDPTGTQVLRRRLAASPAASELRAWLDASPAAAAGPAGIPAAAMTILTARLLTTIAAWQQDAPALSSLRRTLWRLDTATLAASDHPVLAFPEPAPLPVPLP